MRLPLLLVLAATAFAAPADAHPAPARGDGVAFTLPEGWSREARKPGDPRGLAGRLVLTPGRRAPIPAGRLYRLPGRTSREAILAATPGEDAHAFDASWQVKPATLDGTPGEAAWLVRQAYDTGDAFDHGCALGPSGVSTAVLLLG